jgi:hypothetical protein
MISGRTLMETEMPPAFPKFGMDLISNSPLLCELYRKSRCGNLADFLNLGTSGRFQLEGWSDTAEQIFTQAVSVYVRTYEAIERLVTPKPKARIDVPPERPSSSPPAPVIQQPPESLAEGPLTQRILRTCREHGWSSRELLVLRGRYLQRPRARKTLAELGEIHRTSRDRLIEAENSALEKLRAPALSARLKELLHERIRSIWLAMAPGQTTLSKNEPLKELEQRISPDDLFLIRSIHGSLDNWLNSACGPKQDGWSCPVSLDPPPVLEPMRNGNLNPPNLEPVADTSLIAKGCLTRLTSADVRRIRYLLEKRTALLAEIEEINGTLASCMPGKNGAQHETRPSSNTAASPRRRIKEEIVAALKSAGPHGVSVLELSESLEIKPGSLYTWFYITGSKIPQIRKAGPARYCWSETAVSRAGN